MTLTDRELDGMRKAVEELLPSTCYILSVTLTADGAGEFAQSWGTADVQPCRLDPIRGRDQGFERMAGAAVTSFSRYMLTLPHHAAISAGSRVRINAVDYNVLGLTPADDWKLNTRAEVAKI